MDLLRFLLLTIFILLPLGQLARVQLADGIVLNVLDVPVFGLFILLVWGVVKKRGKEKIPRYFMPFILFIMVGLFSLLLRIDELSHAGLIASVGYSLRFIVYIFPFFFLHRYLKNRGAEILSELGIIGFVVVLLGLLQYIFIPELKMFRYLGQWDDHMNRLAGTFFDPNYMGIFIILEILLALSLYLHERHLKKKILYGLVVSVSFISLFLTFSRSSMLVLVSSLVLYLLLFKKKKYILFMLAVFLIGFSSLVLYSKKMDGEGVKLLRMASINARLDSYKEGIGVFIQNPIFGVGFNNYKYHIGLSKAMTDSNYYQSNANNAPSNSFVFILATTGLLGFACFAAFIFMVLKHLFLEVKSSNSKEFIICLIACFFAILLHSMFENSFFYSPLILFMSVMTSGVIAYAIRGNK